MPLDHNWLSTQRLHTRLGSFEFEGGFPADETAPRLRDQLVFNRAVEVFLAQMAAISWEAVWDGVTSAGPAAPHQVVIWEERMDAETLLLTGNTETVYGLFGIDLQRDGPVVVEVPPMMLGGLSDIWQAEIAGIGPTGVDGGKGGKILLLPPGHDGSAPEGYITAASRTFRVVGGVRGFLVDGKPDQAVALMKGIRVYPLSQAANPPATIFVNGSGQEVDTIFPDSLGAFEILADVIAREPADIIDPHERFQLAAIGIEHGKPFAPDAGRKALLDEAAAFAGAYARANSFDSQDEARLAYPDRKWEWAFVGGSATWDNQGYLNTDRRAGFCYIAIGMSPAMVEKIVGGGSQYYWTPRDATGAYLDGAKCYRMRLPADIPVKNFWSVVVYDAESRSMLRSQAYPSVSVYTDPKFNPDGSLDVHFGPEPSEAEGENWIKTLPGKGWFPLLRFYGPLDPFFDKTWKPGDVEPL